MKSNKLTLLRLSYKDCFAPLAMTVNRSVIANTVKQSIIALQMILLISFPSRIVKPNSFWQSIQETISLLLSFARPICNSY